MASLSDILSRRYKGALYGMTDTSDYATLFWEKGNSLPKPTEEELRALSEDVDAEIAADKVKRRQQGILLDRPDALLSAIETLTKAVADIHEKLGIQSPALVQAVADLKGKTDRARAVG